MVREWPVADLDTGIKDPGWVKTLLNPYKQIVQLRTEHLLHIFGAHPTISMLPTDRATESIQNCLVNLGITPHHLLEIVLAVHIEQGDDMGIPIPDMPKDRDWNVLFFEELFQISDEFTDPLSRHHNVVDEIDGLLTGVESVKRGIERFAGLPQLLPLPRLKGEQGIGREAKTSTDLQHAVGLCPKIDTLCI